MSARKTLNYEQNIERKAGRGFAAAHCSAIDLCTYYTSGDHRLMVADCQTGEGWRWWGGSPDRRPEVETLASVQWTHYPSRGLRLSGGVSLVVDAVEHRDGRLLLHGHGIYSDDIDQWPGAVPLMREAMEQIRKRVARRLALYWPNEKS